MCKRIKLNFFYCCFKAVKKALAKPIAFLFIPKNCLLQIKPDNRFDYKIKSHTSAEFYF